MEVSVREMEKDDVKLVVDYFVKANVDFLNGMGVDDKRLPKRADWIEKLNGELDKKPEDKEYFYLIWLNEGHPIGHSNINHIEYGVSANMHLHIWKSEKRQSGLGVELVMKSIPHYFKKFELDKLICEPNAQNPAPNKTLRKIGFEYIRDYDANPGMINYYQTLSRYELTRQRFQLLFVEGRE